MPPYDGFAASLIFAAGFILGWLVRAIAGARAPAPGPLVWERRPVVPLEAGDLVAELAPLLQRGKKIQAIKLYRNRTGAGLAEAKQAVDEIERGGVDGARTGAHGRRDLPDRTP